MSAEATSCGCGTIACAPTEPIACSLVGREQQAKRAAEFQEAFEHLQRTESMHGGFRWNFRNDATLEVLLRGLAQREHECCKFFDFRITREGGELLWETRAPQEAAALAEELRRLPETLERAPRLDAMKAALRRAGLTFASESSDTEPR